MRSVSQNIHLKKGAKYDIKVEVSEAVMHPADDPDNCIHG